MLLLRTALPPSLGKSAVYQMHQLRLSACPLWTRGVRFLLLLVGGLTVVGKPCTGAKVHVGEHRLKRRVLG